MAALRGPPPPPRAWGLLLGLPVGEAAALNTLLSYPVSFPDAGNGVEVEADCVLVVCQC